MHGDYKSVPPTWVKRQKRDIGQEQYLDETGNEDIDHMYFGELDEGSQGRYSMPEVDTIPDLMHTHTQK